MNKLDTKFISLNRNLNHDLQTAQISCNLQSCEISSLNNKGKLVGITKPKFAFDQILSYILKRSLYQNLSIMPVQ